MYDTEYIAEQIAKLRAKLRTIRGNDPVSRTRRAAINRQIWELEQMGENA